MEHVVIIGAGPAGLTAAYELSKLKKYKITILEATNDIGGISKTVNYKGNRMDIGGHRFFSKDQRIIDFWDSILPIVSCDTSIIHDKVMLVRNRVSRIYYLGKFFDYPITMKFKTFKNMGISKTIVCGISYLKSTIRKKEENSLENFYINRFGKKLYSMFFEKYTEKLWGRHPSNISADWGAQRVKGLSIKEILKDMIKKLFNIKGKNVETSLIEKFYYPKYGPGQLWETVAELCEKKGVKILKNHNVIKINRNDSKIISVACLVDSKIKNIKGDIFISSMPIKDFIDGLDETPTKIKKIALGLPYRDFVTIGLLLKKLDLKNETCIKTKNNIIPDCWIYMQEPNVKLGRIQIFNNWSPYMVKDQNTVWIGLEYFCNENDEFWNMSKEECIDFAINELVSLNIIKKEYVIDSHLEKMKKAYPAYFDTYTEIDKVIKYLNKFDNLYCIGRNGQHRYNNMDHSMLTAMKTVECITNPKINKKQIWKINTDKVYHEKK